MPIKNNLEQYGSITRLFHWTIAILVIGMITLGVVMGNIDDKAIRGELYSIHKSFGLLILGLMILRLLWRLNNPTPLLPNHLPSWQKLAAHANHWLLYITLICMPISGLIMSTAAGYPPKFFNLFTVALPIAKNKALSSIAGDIHEILAWVISALIVIHLLGALKHHFIHKDNVLKRMLTGK